MIYETLTRVDQLRWKKKEMGPAGRQDDLQQSAAALLDFEEEVFCLGHRVKTDEHKPLSLVESMRNWALFSTNRCLLPDPVGEGGYNLFTQVVRLGEMHVVPLLYWKLIYAKPIPEYGSLLDSETHAPVGNCKTSVSADRSDLRASRNRQAVNPADRPHLWDDGELLLRPQQVTLGGIHDHNFGGGRVMICRVIIVQIMDIEFQLPDASQVVLRIPRKHDLYTFHISDLQPEQKVTCLVAKASLDESQMARRMAHVPSSSNGLVLWNAMQIMQKSLLRSRQNMKLKDAAARYGVYLCISAVTDPAGIDSAVREPAGIVSADGVSTGSPSADCDPAGSNPIEPTDESNPAVTPALGSESVPTKRVNTIHSSSLILGESCVPVMTRSRAPKIQEPTSIAKALEDPDWVDAMQEEI
ncbi:hypothetical protein Tco_0907570 [Tanacetum coccineum]|uniref:Uncharacterized protein n=1 Tax=Tanacetum coccineum TaxID=301880 RepID=A0ABQ5CKU1_9ASTR